MTLALKACERCGGDMDLTSDPESYCINCGHRPEWAPVLSGHGAAGNVRPPGSPPAEIAKRLELAGSLSVAEVAEWMGVKPEAVKRWIASGLLRVKARRRDQPYRIAWPDVKSFHDERRVAVSQGGFFR